MALLGLVVGEDPNACLDLAEALESLGYRPLVRFLVAPRQVGELVRARRPDLLVVQVAEVSDGVPRRWGDGPPAAASAPAGGDGP